MKNGPKGVGVRVTEFEQCGADLVMTVARLVVCCYKNLIPRSNRRCSVNVAPLLSQLLG